MTHVRDAPESSICEIPSRTFQHSNINISFVKSWWALELNAVVPTVFALCIPGGALSQPFTKHSFYELSLSPAIRSSFETIVWYRVRWGELKDSWTLASCKILLQIKWQCPMLLEFPAQSGSQANHRIIPSNALSSIGFTSDGTSSNGACVCNAFMFTRTTAVASQVYFRRMPIERVTRLISARDFSNRE